MYVPPDGDRENKPNACFPSYLFLKVFYRKMFGDGLHWAPLCILPAHLCHQPSLPGGALPELHPISLTFLTLRGFSATPHLCSAHREWQGVALHQQKPVGSGSPVRLPGGQPRVRFTPQLRRRPAAEPGHPRR